MRPNLVIVGVHKCGTTALHNYLGLHPQVFMSRTKELNFFVEELNWSRGLEWYEPRFDQRAAEEGVRVFGESSPSYANYPKVQGVAERMASTIPDAKLIFMVRDPVERVISHYRMERARGPAQRSLVDSALKHFRNPFVKQSMYWLQLRQFVEHFPMSRIMVLSQEELLEARRRTLRRAFEFIEVDPTFDHPEFDELHNTTDGREIAAFGARAALPQLPEDLRWRLIEHLRPDIDEFRAHLGLGFEEWCV